MRLSARLQFLTCLMLYASSAQAIMVKYGTKGGPIEPPAPEHELPAPQPYRAPAPVWEERSNDSPDPNAQWRPQLFNPEPRYTQVIYKAPVPAPVPLNSAQRFVNAYIPTNRPNQPQLGQNYFTPTQFLSSQSLPGIGLRYFVPAYINDAQNRVEQRQEDAKQNHIESTDVNGGNRDSVSDQLWKYEKDATRRNVRTTQEAAAAPIYIWPAYVPPVHQ